mgnify:CR=1 FL=1|jgi:hypothetical protein
MIMNFNLFCGSISNKNNDLKIFDELKLRAGWGQIGNHGIGSYGTLSNYGVSPNLYGNPDGGTNVPIALQNVANPKISLLLSITLKEIPN